MAHVLYRFYSATGQLLYVGITMNPLQRFADHRERKGWWCEVVGITLEHYTNRKELLAAEKRAIKVERPLHNIIHSVAPRPGVANKVDLTPVTRWFKPIWYGAGRAAGRTRRVSMAPGTEFSDEDDVDADGRLLVTWAPRPDDWIEQVAALRAAGVPSTAIESAVSCVMSSDTAPADLWAEFLRQCRTPASAGKVNN